MADGTCAQCGTATKNPYYCSNRCAALARGAQRRIQAAANPKPRIRYQRKGCPVAYGTCMCGKLFIARNGRRYCSDLCIYRAHNPPVEPHTIECGQCGVAFFGKWLRLCAGCSESNARATKRNARASRRAAESRRPYRRQDIFERDGWRCHLCRKLVAKDQRVPHSQAPTLDHLVPLSAGGSDAADNVATAHFICNSRRSAGGIAQLRLIA